MARYGLLEGDEWLSAKVVLEARLALPISGTLQDFHVYKMRDAYDVGVGEKVS